MSMNVGWVGAGLAAAAVFLVEVFLTADIVVEELEATGGAEWMLFGRRPQTRARKSELERQSARQRRETGGWMAR